MKKTGHYAAFIGLLSAVALSVTACGAPAKAPAAAGAASTDTEQIAAINVDKNGIFYIPEEKKFYKVKAGTFHFETLDQIYKDSMYADGFDENQCLIQ